MKNSLLLSFLVAAVGQWLLLTTVQSKASFQTRVHIDEKTIANEIQNPVIEAYDLSPDGTRVALLVVSGDPMQSPVPSWVVVLSTVDSRFLKQVRLGTRPQWVQGYASQIAFTADGRFLVVEDGQPAVSILDADTLATVRTIVPAERGSGLDVPVSVMTAANNDMVAISFGAGLPVSNFLDKLPVRVTIFDVSNGQEIASWNAEDVPLSLSPNAKFVAVSDHSSPGPVMGVTILDAKSGKRIVTLSGGYPNRTPQYPNWNGQFWTRLIAKFISDDEVAMTPDGNKDQSGHDLGGNVKVVSVRDDRIIQVIGPHNYGPRGEIAISADESTLVAISLYVAPQYLTHHWRIPSDTGPEFLVFSKQRPQMFDLANRAKLPELLRLRIGGRFNTSGLRVSRDGSVISVAEDYGVTILARATTVSSTLSQKSVVTIPRTSRRISGNTFRPE